MEPKEKKTVVKTFKRILKSNSEKKKKQKVVVFNAIKNLIVYLESNCLDLEGICRVSGNAVKVKELKKSLENEEDIDFSKIIDKHTISGALKMFLRENDEPVLTFDLYKNFLATVDIKDKNAKVSFIKSIISALPKDNFDLLQTILKFLYTLQLHSQKNKMTSANLAIVFSPTLLRPKEETLETMMLDSNVTNEVVKLMIEEFNTLFEVKTGILYKLNSQDLGIVKDEKKLSLQDQLEEAKEKIENLSKQLSEESRERSILETYNNSIELKLAEMTDNYKILQEERDGISDLLLEYKESIKSQTEEIENLKRDTVELNGNLQSEKNQNSSISKELESLKTSTMLEIEELKKTIRHKSQENENLKIELKSNAEKYDIISNKLNSLVKERDDANAQVERLQAEISLLSQQSSSSSGRSKTSLSSSGKRDFDRKHYESKISQLEKDKYALTEQISKLQKQQQQTATTTTTTTTHKFVPGKKPQKEQPPPPIDEDDIVSVKKFAFYWLILALKTDAMNTGKKCNIVSGDVLDELLAKNIKVALWNDFVLKKLKELD
ncbi:RhoGAP domain-containing protein [Tieghemostelium lacteum]|uniref:RhoGAP domain-containing protein n=1 Tax=Tieghemostelium lacteum TaxID=361077 RepID=A0A152A7R8_TIELA|nr:RhoGAP domain-containing protein [Tieghemostelium lacteum]|eukprot:KYR02279.1 RhoGAP domain-containing protein [Tieghemostelium lacteum]